jgi:hypothetical protein
MPPKRIRPSLSIPVGPPSARIVHPPSPKSEPRPARDLFDIFHYPGGGTLYLSDVQSAQDSDLIAKYGIKAVVNACRVAESCQAPRYSRFPGVEYLELDLYDPPSEEIELITAICQSHRFIERHLSAGRNVLVHCYAGKSRSVTLLAAYLMLYHGDWIRGLPDGVDFSGEDNTDKVLSHIESVKRDIEPKIQLFMELAKIGRDYAKWLEIHCPVTTKEPSLERRRRVWTDAGEQPPGPGRRSVQKGTTKQKPPQVVDLEWD